MFKLLVTCKFKVWNTLQIFRILLVGTFLSLNFGWVFVKRLNCSRKVPFDLARLKHSFRSVVKIDKAVRTLLSFISISDTY